MIKILKIAVIGPNDSLQKIKEISLEFNKNVNFLFHEAHTLKDSSNTVKALDKNIDAILFSGPSVFDAAIDYLPKDIPYAYVSYNETSLLSLLANNSLGNIKNISVDVLSEKILKETITETPIESFKVLSHKAGYTEKEYIDFHNENIKQNNSDAILTTFSPIYDYFSSRNIPVFRLYTTKFTIRNTIHNLILEINNKLVDNAKVAIQIIKLKLEDYSLPKVNNLETIIQFESSLIPYLKILDGTIFNYSKNEYIIISTKGLIESSRAKNKFYEIISTSKLSINSGIGIGLTVAQSEMNAICALEHSLLTNESCFYIKHEDSTVEGPIMHENVSSYKTRSVELNLDEISIKSGLSVKYLQKIINIVQIHGVNEFSTSQFAHYLGVSLRSARRVLKILVDNNYATISGKESSVGNGRPKNIVKILLGQ